MSARSGSQLKSSLATLTTVVATGGGYLWKNHHNSRHQESPENPLLHRTAPLGLQMSWMIHQNAIASAAAFHFPLGKISVTHCDASEGESAEAKQSKPKNDNEGLNNYPNLSRLGPHSYLRKYLTPEVYLELKDKKTSTGVSLEDVFQGGISLPWAANPDRIGVFAGDEECYTVFAPLFMPIIQEFHGIKTSSGRGGRSSGGARLRRSSTNLNPQDVLSQELDPDGDRILYSRMRVSRSISGFQFGTVISRYQRRNVEELCKSCFDDWKNSGDPVFERSTYTSVLDMTNEQYNDLSQRHLIFLHPSQYKSLSGLGRDWPDGRGLFLNDIDLPEIQVWVNHQDHLRVISMSRGGDLLAVFTRLSQTIRALERSLHRRGYKFCEDPKLGFLNTSPENIGTGLRASVYVKLVRLGRLPGFKELVERLKLKISPRFAEHDRRYTGIFDIANAERLGQNEVELINTMINGVGRLIELEKRLEKGEKLNLDDIRF